MYEYYIVCGDGLKSLEQQVSKRLNSGWQLAGGIFIDADKVCIQAMFRKS